MNLSLCTLWFLWLQLESWFPSVFGFVTSSWHVQRVRPRRWASIRVGGTTTTPSNNQNEIYYDVSAIPCREGTVEVTRENSTFELSYKVLRPMSLSSRKAAPIVALHGGPSVPSDYLLPLAKVVPYRSILFYDQLGCGLSDEPAELSAYSIENAVTDLETVLQKLSIRRFHLYGQSFGGILAFEYLKRVAERKKSLDSVCDNEEEGCLSVILSSTPCNVSQVEKEAQTIIDALEDANLFRERHQCRTVEMPGPLKAAYDHAGTTWRGTTAIANYAAKPLHAGAERTPSALVLRGEYDFVTAPCVTPWKDLLWTSRSVRFQTLAGCSHHGLLEQPLLYGDIVESFFAEYD